jgi:glutamate racemase
LNKSIGVIDSGVGGLTVVKEMMRQLPKEEIVYIGDTARCPYGPRPCDEVRVFTWNMANDLVSKGIKMLVIACNTATAFVLQEIQHALDIPVIGVVHPGARSAIKVTKNNHVAVIGTIGTIQSKAYEQALKSINSDVAVNSLACPLFVPLVEYGHLNEEEAEQVVRTTLEPLKRADIDTMVLGCTHYPLLKSVIQKVMGPQITLICSAVETAREVSTLLYHNELLYTGEREPRHHFYSTAARPEFAEVANSLLDRKITVDLISLEKSLSIC